jgi:peptide/nickel transport system ATP-binding protein
MTGSILRARDLAIEYATRRGPVRSLDGASLTVAPGQIVALVGESGSGKTTLGMATGRLLASNARHVGGELLVAGHPMFGPGMRDGRKDVRKKDARRRDIERIRALRREVLGFVFQNPVAALNPTMRVRRQLELVGTGSVTEALQEVGLPDIPRVLRSYPHELSGGMAQRVGIAMALRRRPRLLVADEPTTAVDATLRARILRLLVARCRARGCALLLLTHDLHAVAEHCEQIAVMYGGRVVEHGPTGQVLDDPMHPYTRALVGALPGEEEPGQRLTAIGGTPPVLRAACPGCAFAPRCPDVLDRCNRARPVYAAVDGRHLACHLHTTGAHDAAQDDAASHNDAEQQTVEQEEAAR